MRRTRSTRLALMLAALLLATPSTAGALATASGRAEAAQAGTRSYDHAFGTTEIPRQPRRVVVAQHAFLEAFLELGIPAAGAAQDFTPASGLEVVRAGRVVEVPDESWFVGTGIIAANRVVDDLFAHLVGAAPVATPGATTAAAATALAVVREAALPVAAASPPEPLTPGTAVGTVTSYPSTMLGIGGADTDPTPNARHASRSTATRPRHPARPGHRRVRRPTGQGLDVRPGVPSGRQRNRLDRRRTVGAGR
jgi:hypothetical protein